MIKESRKQDIQNRALIGLRVIFIFFGIFFLFTNIVLASSLPLPGRTKVIREEVIEQAGEECKMFFCESELSQEKVSSFYQKELSARGYSLFLNLDTMQMYKKEGKTFMVVVSSNPEGKTNIVLTQGGGLDALGKATRSRNTPDCEDIPNVPVYPGVRCLDSIRMRKMQSLVQRYSVAVDAYRIADFYRQEMPRYGWYIENETDMAQVLSDRREFSGAGATGLDFEGSTQMSFKDNQGVGCVITVMPAIMGSGSMINIMYNESKRQ